MPKITTYACDKCNQEEDYVNLASIYVYCFGIDEEEPKILEWELVCISCREQFVEVVRSWSS